MDIAYWNNLAFEHTKLAEYAKQKKYDDVHRVMLFYAGSDQTN